MDVKIREQSGVRGYVQNELDDRRRVWRVKKYFLCKLLDYRGDISEAFPLLNKLNSFIAYKHNPPACRVLSPGSVKEFSGEWRRTGGEDPLQSSSNILTVKWTWQDETLIQNNSDNQPPHSHSVNKGTGSCSSSENHQERSSKIYFNFSLTGHSVRSTAGALGPEGRGVRSVRWRIIINTFFL